MLWWRFQGVVRLLYTRLLRGRVSLAVLARLLCVDLRPRANFWELRGLVVMGRAARLVFRGDLGSRVYFLPCRSVRFLSRPVIKVFFEGVVLRFDEYRGTMAVFICVYICCVLSPFLRFRLLFARECGGIFRRSPVRGHAGLVGPYRFRANGLIRLRRQLRDNDCRPFLVIGVGGSVRRITELATFKCVAHERWGLSIVTSVWVGAGVCFFCGLRLIMFSRFCIR